MTRILHGKIRGKTIELIEDADMPEGQDVEVQIKVSPAQATPDNGILRSAGAMADDPYFDDIMAEIYRARKLERTPRAEAE